MIYGTMCYLKNGGETLFLCRDRGEGDIHRGLHTPPGGHLEAGESSIDCIVREFEEETGLKLLDPRLKVRATFYNKGRILGGKENPEDWKVDIYEANTFSGELRREHPKDKLVWVGDAEIPNIKMHEGDRKIIELVRKEGLHEVSLRYFGEELDRFEVQKIS